MDEATSNIDNYTDKKILNSLNILNIDIDNNNYHSLKQCISTIISRNISELYYFFVLPPLPKRVNNEYYLLFFIV